MGEGPHAPRFPGGCQALCGAGDGPLRAATEEAILEHGLAGKINLPGMDYNVPRMLAACHIMVLPTYWEGLPIVLIEGLRAGLPLVASKVGGIPEMIQHGKNGYLFTPGDPEQLAQALQHLIDSPKRRADMGAISRHSFLQTFTAERMLEQTLAVYNQVLSNTAANGSAS